MLKGYLAHLFLSWLHFLIAPYLNPRAFGLSIQNFFWRWPLFTQAGDMNFQDGPIFGHAGAALVDRPHVNMTFALLH